MIFLRRLTCAWLLLFVLVGIAQAQASEAFAGHWQGSIEAPDDPIEVEVGLQLVDEAWQGTIEIPAQGVVDQPLEDISIQDDEIGFAIPGVPGDPTFAGTLINDTIKGTFTQAGQEFPFSLQRVAEPAPEVDLGGVEPLPVAEVLPELEAFIHENMEAFGIPGAAVAIVQNGEVVYLEGFGVRETGGDEPITPDTHMMIGSTGKTMTTMLMATLVDEGLMAWDTPAVEILPEFAVADPELTERIAMRHLVCNCAEVPARDIALFFNHDALSAEAVIESVGDFEVFTVFGEAFQYSNYLIATGGYVAAAADAASFGELLGGYASSLQERVLAPVGMNDTTLSIQEVRSRGEHAVPHQLDFLTGTFEPISLEFEEVVIPVAPAGAQWSTAADMARYLQTLLALGVAPDGTHVVSEENLSATWEPQVSIDPEPGIPPIAESYGLGWFLGEYKGLAPRLHPGVTTGFSSDFALLPEAGLGIVVLSNAREADIFNMGVRTRLFELVYEQPAEAQEQIEFGLSQLEEFHAELQEQILEQVDPEALEPYLGTYVDEVLGEITLVLEEGVFILDAGAFRTELLPMVDEAGEVEHYLTLMPPLRMLPVVLSEDEIGNPIVEVGMEPEVYTLTKVE